MADTKFIDGLSWFDPSSREPEWIKGRISIKLNQFMKFAEENQDRKGFLTMEIRQSKKGNLYVALKEPRPETPQEQDARQDEELKKEIAELEQKVEKAEEVKEEIPF